MIEWLFVCRIILQPWQKYLVILNPAGMGAVRNTHAALHNAGKPFFYDDSLINISLSAWKYSEQPGISCCPVFQLSSPLLCWRNKDLASRPKTELKAKWKESLTGTLKASSHCWTADNGITYFYIYWCMIYISGSRSTLELLKGQVCLYIWIMPFQLEKVYLTHAG